MNFDAIFAEAYKACNDSIRSNIAHVNWYPCGFAHIQMPARGKFATWLKDKKLASAGYPKGLDMCYSLIDNASYASNPPMGQNMTLKEVGLGAALAVFQKHGLLDEKSYVSTRMD